MDQGSITPEFRPSSAGLAGRTTGAILVINGLGNGRRANRGRPPEARLRASANGRD